MSEIVLPNGYSGAILIPRGRPTFLGTAWGVKKRSKALEVLKKSNPFGLTQEDLARLALRKLLRADKVKGDLTWDEVLRWAEKYFQRTKEDAYNFIGGSFDPIDFSKARADGRPNAFARRCLYRELDEEFFKEGSNPQFSLEYLFTLIRKSFGEGGGRYEENFYLLHFAGELKEDGCPDETDAPEIIPMTSLYPEKFAKKSAFVLRMFLRNMVEERKLREYEAPLRHISRVFGESLQGFKFEIRNKESALDISAEPQTWEALAQAKDFVPMQK